MPVFNIENLEDAQTVVRHYGPDFKGCGNLTEQSLADHVYMWRVQARAWPLRGTAP